ncbi:unnamed protein product [Protopolystoma xenopodis]|uniref:Uncharacterized protein n=1 Tax=Protopolystoma xenopodis TaxID=117903 RepID=A0A448WT01_9PLAT|nr:unnamed protein product [Protopolystoma xenopodis]
MPSVWKLQALLESAWSSGFDPAGAAQISDVVRQASNLRSVGAPPHRSETNGLVGLVDSTVWLGATDLAALLGSVGVRCCLVECIAAIGPRGTHPNCASYLDFIRGFVLSSYPLTYGTTDVSAQSYLLLDGYAFIFFASIAI